LHCKKKPEKVVVVEYSILGFLAHILQVYSRVYSKVFSLADAVMDRAACKYGNKNGNFILSASASLWNAWKFTWSQDFKEKSK